MELHYELKSTTSNIQDGKTVLNVNAEEFQPKRSAAAVAEILQTMKTKLKLFLFLVFYRFYQLCIYIQFYFRVQVSCKVAFEERICSLIVNTNLWGFFFWIWSLISIILLSLAKRKTMLGYICSYVIALTLYSSGCSGWYLLCVKHWFWISCLKFFFLYPYFCSLLFLLLLQLDLHKVCIISRGCQ